MQLSNLILCSHKLNPKINMSYVYLAFKAIAIWIVLFAVVKWQITNEGSNACMNDDSKKFQNVSSTLETVTISQITLSNHSRADF